MTATPPSAGVIRLEFKPRLRRGEVMLLGARLGLTQWTVRCLLRERQIPPIIYIGCKRAYFDRDAVLAVMMPDQ